MEKKQLMRVNAAKMGLGFNLREPRANKSTQVYAVVRFGRGKHLKFPMGKVNSWEWDAQREIPIIRERMHPTDRANAMNVLQRISAFRFGYLNFFSYICTTGELRMTSEEIREELNNRTRTPHAPIIIQNNNGIETNGRETDMNKKTGNLVYGGGRVKSATAVIKKAFADYQKQHQLAQSSVRIYASSVKQFCDYCKKKGDSIKRLSQQGIEDYQEWLLGKGESHNAINRKCNIIVLLVNKGILNKAKQGLTSISVATLHVEKKTAEEKVRRPLTNAEVSKLEQCKGLKPRQREWADLFLLQIYCGCRNSDLHRFFDIKKHRTDEIDKEMIISFRTTKSQEKQTVQIPMTPQIESILNRYSGGFRYVKFNDNFNHTYTDNIRRYAKQAGLDNIEHFVEDGKEKTAPLYKVIAGHFGRYTFVHKMIAEGYTPDEIAPMTGHTDGNMIRQIYGVLDHQERTSQVVNIIKKVQGRNTKVKQATQSLNEVREYQDVLRFFGCPYSEFEGIEDSESLLRLIVTKYEIPLTTQFDYTTKQLKAAYNNRDWAEQDRIYRALCKLQEHIAPHL